ncbi:MAG TPA: hypothetical protein VFH70_04410, partial [Acidimicrobiales bacterium]|nr:hypothetical protein [Acidimicrobiales bacterium]
MASSPSPLPIPQQAAPQNPLAQALTALSRAVPNIDPEVATGIAQGTQSPGEAVNAGQAAQGYTEAVNTANYLKQQSSTNQLALWNQLTAAEQKMVNGAGYRPPHPGRSLLGTITHDVGQGVHDTLNAAGAPLRAVQHGIRSAFAIVNQPGDPMSGSLDFQRFLSPSEWAHAWNQTSNGEHYILPQVQQQVLKKYGQQTYDLAMKLATGGNAAQIVAAAPQAQQQQLAQQIQGDPKLHQALQELDAGHVSEGRMLAYRVLGLKAGSEAGNLLSGAADATIDWFGDPVVVGAKAAKVAGTARYLVQNGEDVQRIYQSNGAVQSAFADIASKVSSKDWTGLASSYPKLVPMFDSIREWNPTTADDVAAMFSDEANVRSIISGNAASLPGGVEGGVLPFLSPAGKARLAVKGELQKVIDWAADRPATIEGLQPGDVIDHELTAAGKGPTTRLVTASGQF